MKVNLTVELDVPGETSEEHQEGLGQLLFDAYINYATCNHLKDALQWCAKGGIGSDNEDLSAKLIYEYHDTWGKICNNAKWNFEVLQ